MEGLGWIVAVLAPLAFVGMWCLVLGLLSLVSGWRTLAQRYSHPTPFTGERLLLRSARLGVVTFNHVLYVGKSPQGLHLEPMILFRPFHPALLIPWSQLRAQAGRFLIFDHIELSLLDGSSTRLRSGSLPAEWLAPYLTVLPPSA